MPKRAGLPSTILHPVMAIRPFFFTTLALAVTGCAAPAAGERRDSMATRTSTASSYDVGRQLDVFRASAGTRPTRLRHGASSRDELVRLFALAIVRSDTAALQRLALDRPEFAWLYYQDSPQSRPPYELDPDIMWEQIQARSRRGLTRALREYGGRLVFRSYRCTGTPERAGAIRLHHACIVTHVVGGTPLSEQLFGSIIERDGQFKFVGLSNHL